MSKKKVLISGLLALQLTFSPVINVLATEFNYNDTNENESSKLLLNEKQIFLDNNTETALRIGKEIEVLPSLILAEMSVLSEWGTQEAVNGNNYFSILDDSGDSYKTFTNVEDSIRDYYHSHPEFVGVKEISDIYLTIDDDEYLNALVEVMEEYDLTSFDEEILDESKDGTNEKTENDNDDIIEEEEEISSTEDNEEVIEDTDTEEKNVNEGAEETEETEENVTTFFAETNHITTINYTATINDGGYSIYRLSGNQLTFLSDTSNFKNQQVYAKEEAIVGNDVWTHIYTTSSKEIGWIAKNELDIETVLQNKYTDYKAIITKKGYTIDTLPWGTEGYTNLSKSDEYLNQVVQVIEEQTTRRSTFLLIKIGDNVLGWVDKNSLSLNGIINEKVVKYGARIKNLKENIYSLPEELEGAKKVANSSEHKNSNFVVIKEAETFNGNYSFVTLYGKDLGWIKTEALEAEVILESKDIIYGAKIVTKNNTVDTLPYGVDGFESIARTDKYLNDNILVIKEVVTRRGTFAYVYRYGKELGWIDVKALKKEKITKKTAVHYAAKIVGQNNTIDTLPYGVQNFKTIARSPEYINTKVIVTEEAVTTRGTFSLISINGKELGWIDKKALSVESVLKTTSINYAAKIVTKNNSIDTLPYGVSNFKTIARTSAYFNQNVVVSEEKETVRGTFALIFINGKELGWVDTKALDAEVVLSTKDVHYGARITTKNNSIDTMPYGVRGFENISKSAVYYGTDIVVTQEKVTRRGTFAYIYRYGKELGWIDKRALNEEVVTSTRNTSYTATINKTGYTLDTLPYGISGFKNISKSDNYLKTKVNVIQEKVTRRGTFALIKVNGKELGWIDKKAFGYTIFIDPGHGGSDPGAQYFGVQEKTINLQVSKKVQNLLQSKGYSVIMARTADIAIDFKTERSKMANNSNADIFVSIHHNAMPGNSTANGIETYYYEYDPDYPSIINGTLHNDPKRILESSKLATAIHGSLVSKTGAYNRGVRRETFAVLRETAIPAVLLELGYMSNQTELNKLTSNSYQDTLAKAIADGIDSYFK